VSAAAPQTGWRKASRSVATNDKCVELHSGNGLVRDSKNEVGPALSASLAGLVGFARSWRPVR
jgi:hypothetical protein